MRFSAQPSLIQCPFCGQSTSAALRYPTLSDGRECACGAIALGASREDFSQIIIDAVKLFGADDGDRTRAAWESLAMLRARGTEIREGRLVANNREFGALCRYFWFRKPTSPA